MLWETVRFNFAGRKYTLTLDDGQLCAVRLPGGEVVFDLPPELSADPRLQRFLRQKQEYYFDCLDAGDNGEGWACGGT